MARRRRQRGVAMITIMVVMVITMLIASTLVNHLAVQEAHAIEQHLAEVRAHWAMVGHVNYVLSRARYRHHLPAPEPGVPDPPPPPPPPDLCNTGTGVCADSLERLTAVANLAKELETTASCNLTDPSVPAPPVTNPTTPALTRRRWIYSGSEFPVDASYCIAVTQMVSPFVPDVAGRIRFQFSISSVGPFETLKGLKVANLWVDICLVNTLDTTCQSLTDQAYGRSLITRVTRVLPP